MLRKERKKKKKEDAKYRTEQIKREMIFKNIMKNI